MAYTVLDKRDTCIKINIFFFLNSSEKNNKTKQHMLRYSLEAPLRGFQAHCWTVDDRVKFPGLMQWKKSLYRNIRISLCEYLLARFPLRQKGLLQFTALDYILAEGHGNQLCMYSFINVFILSIQTDRSQQTV